MFSSHRIAVVIPCYRVAAHVPAVLSGVPAFVDDVVLVDDGSPDALQGAVAPWLAGSHDGATRCHLVRHETNQGLAAAMRTGYVRALALGADIVVKMDGDGQMDPDALPRLLGPIVAGEVDFTKGNRFFHRRYFRTMPRLRKIGNLALSFVAKVASGYWHVFDPTNGYLAIRREVLETIDLARLGPGYFFEISMLAEAYLAGAVLADVPIPARYHDEPSSLSVRRVLREFPPRLLAATVRRVALRYFVRDFTAVSVFLAFGFPLVLFGLSFALWHWYANYGTGVPTPTGTIVLAVVPLLAGFQLLLQALVMDVANAPRRSVWQRRGPTGAV